MLAEVQTHKTKKPIRPRPKTTPETNLKKSRQMNIDMIIEENESKMENP